MIVEFFLMFHKDKPIDWLLDHILWVKVCNPEKDAVSTVLTKFPLAFSHVAMLWFYCSLKSHLHMTYSLLEMNSWLVFAESELLYDHLMTRIGFGTDRFRRTFWSDVYGHMGQCGQMTYSTWHWHHTVDRFKTEVYIERTIKSVMTTMFNLWQTCPYLQSRRHRSVIT